MKPFLATPRRLYELAALAAIDIGLYLFTPFWDFLILFNLGFIWNWVAAQDVSLLLQNRRFKFSMLKLVSSIQVHLLRPFERFPNWVQAIVRSLPAGIFWTMVILFNDSEMPWYMPFIGSVVFEVLQIEIAFFHKRKDRVS
jgi:hypothetical protein